MPASFNGTAMLPLAPVILCFHDCQGPLADKKLCSRQGAISAGQTESSIKNCEKLIFN